MRKDLLANLNVPNVCQYKYSTNEPKISDFSDDQFHPSAICLIFCLQLQCSWAIFFWSIMELETYLDHFKSLKKEGVKDALALRMVCVALEWPGVKHGTKVCCCATQGYSLPLLSPSLDPSWVSSMALPLVEERRFMLLFPSRLVHWKMIKYENPPAKSCTFVFSMLNLRTLTS